MGARVRFLVDGRPVTWTREEDVQTLLESFRSHMREERPDLELQIETVNPCVKTLRVNWENLDEIAAALSKIKSRYFELLNQRTGRISKRERSRQILDSCQKIWDTDISSIYTDIKPSSPRKFYVYAHLDTTQRNAPGVNGFTTWAATLGMLFRPFYVGKGTGDRCYELNRSETHRKICQKISRLGKAVTVFKIKENLTEAEALQYEAKLIDIFGLVPFKGLLTNLDEGHRSNERRMKYSEAFTALRRINRVTHVNSPDESGRTRVVPASSTGCSISDLSNAQPCGAEIDSTAAIG